MIDITIEGLNAEQQLLANIIWSYDDYADVQRFINSLPKRQKIEAQGIVELMKMATLEQLYDGITDNPEASKVIKRLIDKK
jgi:hypothetical protein